MHSSLLTLLVHAHTVPICDRHAIPRSCYLLQAIIISLSHHWSFLQFHFHHHYHRPLGQSQSRLRISFSQFSYSISPPSGLEGQFDIGQDRFSTRQVSTSTQHHRIVQDQYHHQFSQFHIFSRQPTLSTSFHIYFATRSPHTVFSLLRSTTDYCRPFSLSSIVLPAMINVEQRFLVLQHVFSYKFVVFTSYPFSYPLISRDPYRLEAVAFSTRLPSSTTLQT